MLLFTEWTVALSQHLTHLMMQATVEEVFGQLRGPLARTLSRKVVQDHITHLFLAYFLQKDSKGKLLYEERIRDMCIGNALFKFAQTASSILHEAQAVKYKGMLLQQKLR